MNFPGKLYCLDFETYYDKDYSLKKMPGFEYIADPRFKVHMLQVLDEDGNELVLRPEEIAPWLEQVRLGENAVLGQNLYFDGMILAHHYGVIPGFLIDTKGMANLLYRPLLKSSSLETLSQHLLGRGKIAGTLASVAGVRELTEQQFKALAEYGIEDVRLTMEVFQAMAEEFPEDEYPIMDAHIRLYLRKRMRIDAGLAKELLEEREAEKRKVAAEVTKRWGHLLPEDLTVWQALRRNPVVAEIIKSVGKLPPRKRSIKKGTLEYAFAKDDLMFQAFRADPNLELLVRAKTLANSTILESRLARLLRMHELYDGWAHPLLNYAGAHTARSAGGDKLNYQNIPKKPERFRHIFAPPTGHKVVIADSGQIEARVLGYLAGQEDLLEAFREADRLIAAGKNPKKLGKDVYTVMARKIGAGGNRDLGKAVTLGCGFGMSETKFVLTARAAGNDAPEEQLRAAHAGWRHASPDIVRFWEEYAWHFQEAALSGKEMTFKQLGFETRDDRFFVWLPSGRPLVYGRVRSNAGGLTDAMGRNLWYGLLVENLVQAYARDVVFQQVLAEPALREYLWLLVHDEADLVVPEAIASETLELALKALSTPRPWASDLPTIGEGAVADTLIKA